MSQDNYKKTMQRKKAHIEKKISEANIDKGLIVLLTGNGKAKSTIEVCDRVSIMDTAMIM